MKVKIVEEVMACDVSPVAMFLSSVNLTHDNRITKKNCKSAKQHSHHNTRHISYLKLPKEYFINFGAWFYIHSVVSYEAIMFPLQF